VVRPTLLESEQDTLRHMNFERQRVIEETCSVMGLSGLTTEPVHG
jgi:hypothetical protein